MKKIGFIALALVTLFATLGIGFSMWSQTVTINGSVSTGNVTLQVSNYSATIAYKDANSALQFTEASQAVWPPTTPAGALWGPAFADVATVNGNPNTGAAVSCTSEAGIVLGLVYQNLFPVPNPAVAGTFKPWCADFDLKNTGSIPVKLEVSPISAVVSSPAGVGALPVSVVYTQNGNVFNAEGKQLEPNDVVHVEICITVNEDTVQSYNGSFSLNISGVQWNEYRAAGAVETSVPRDGAGSTTTTVLVSNLQPSWTTTGGGGVYSVYYGPNNGYAPVSPGSVTIIDGRSAAPIYAGVTIDPTDHVYEDQGLLGFQPGLTPIATFAAQPFTYDFKMQTGVNPVWVYIEINKGLPGDTMYQYVPTSNPSGWHTENAGSGAHWQAWTDLLSGVPTGPMLSLAQIAAANPTAVVSRVYLSEGMGNSYNVSPGVGTFAWVDTVTIGTVIYNF